MGIRLAREYDSAIRAKALIMYVGLNVPAPNVLAADVFGTGILHWYSFKFYFVLQKHCDVSCFFLTLNTVNIMWYASITSSCCRKLFVPLSTERSGWCTRILGRPRGFAKPQSTNPHKARDVSFVIIGQGQEVCEESRYLIATLRMVPPAKRARRAGFTAHMHTSDYQKGRFP